MRGPPFSGAIFKRTLVRIRFVRYNRLKGERVDWWLGMVARIPEEIEVYGARVHNLRSVDVKVPLHKIVGIAGVSGSGKSSLALGVLYAEGSRRYLEALSTYTRRRLTQAARADVDLVKYVPAALALHQRPPVPGVRSTFGTMTEVLNSLRLLFSRVGSYTCPTGTGCRRR